MGLICYQIDSKKFGSLALICNRSFLQLCIPLLLLDLLHCDRTSKKSRYIPKRLVARVEEIEADKVLVGKILEMLFKRDYPQKTTRLILSEV